MISIEKLSYGFTEIWETSGIYTFGTLNLIMLLIAFVLLYLGIKKVYEPLLLIPIAFGMILTNIPATGIMAEPHNLEPGGLLYYIFQGVQLEIFPPLIFLGIGAMTDFGPLISKPSSFILGAAAQFGVYFAFLFSLLMGFTNQEAAAIAIIGGADGPTSIYLASKLAPDMLGPIAVASYSYMALVPLIQPPIIKLLTTVEERKVKMDQMRRVSKLEKLLFPITVTVITVLIMPKVAPLVGMLMLGNIFKESGVTDRLSETSQNALINITTIFLGLSVGATAKGEVFLQPHTLLLVGIGLLGFIFSTAGGVIIGKIMYHLSGKKINPIIGAAGVSAVPMAAKVSHIMGRKEDPTNFLIMHAMGPNLAGVIGTAVAAGVFLNLFLK